MLRSLRLLRALVIAGSLSALVAASGEVRAQGRDPVAATELFTQGRELLKQGDFDKACTLFAESFRLDPAVGTALNLAECEERRGHLTQALRSWQQAVNLAEATNDERGQVARERLEALSPRVPRLTIVLAGDAPEGTVVKRENVELGDATLGRSLPVDPGDHIITVIAPGRQEWRETVMLREGEDRKVVVSPGPPIEPKTPVAPKPVVIDTGADDAPSRRTMAYVFGGVGAAGVLAAVVSGVMLLDSRKVVDERCDDRDRCDQQGLDAADRGKLLVPVNTIAWAVGVAGLGAGSYFYFTTPPADASSRSAARPSGAYLQLQGTF